MDEAISQLEIDARRFRALSHYIVLGDIPQIAHDFGERYKDGVITAEVFAEFVDVLVDSLGDKV